MLWIYILQCADGYYYVGQTSRLYRRFWEHFNGAGGVNTYIYKPEEILAIYSVDQMNDYFNIVENNSVINQVTTNVSTTNVSTTNVSTTNVSTTNVSTTNVATTNLVTDTKRTTDININDLRENNTIAAINAINAMSVINNAEKIENYIVEKLQIHNAANWKKYRGGKYVQFIDYQFPENKSVESLPMCKCGLPCSVRKSRVGNLYFYCAKKNFWSDMCKVMAIKTVPCDYYAKPSTEPINETKQETKSELAAKSITESITEPITKPIHIPIYKPRAAVIYEPKSTMEQIITEIKDNNPFVIFNGIAKFMKKKLVL